MPPLGQCVGFSLIEDVFRYRQAQTPILVPATLTSVQGRLLLSSPYVKESWELISALAFLNLCPSRYRTFVPLGNSMLSVNPSLTRTIVHWKQNGQAL
jgi:hypothetical protein